MNGVEFSPKNPVASFVDQYGDEQVIHRPKGRRLSIYKGGNTPILRMNRAVAILMGQLIRAKRLERGLSQRELCVRAGFVGQHPKQRIYAIESATRNEGIRLGTLYALADALDCDVSDLLPNKSDVMQLAGVTRQHTETLSV
jgi:DNA-binding Xre family transcriptional regulator